MANCLFCKMVSGEVVPDTVYESDQVLAFRDINPQAPVHILVIPKRHVDTLDALPDDATLANELLRAARVVASDAGLSGNGYRVVVNCGNDGGQAVYHLHLHVLGGRAMHWPPG